MSDELQEELLSAYLDGETSAEERARVDAWLAHSPEARQSLEELRSVRLAVKSLPPHEISGNLVEGVLRRTKANANNDGEQQRAADGPITPVALTRKWRARGTWRRVFWPAAAIAAALLIALFEADRMPPEKDVALAHPRQGESYIQARKNEVAPAVEGTSQDNLSAQSGQKVGQLYRPAPASESKIAETPTSPSKLEKPMRSESARELRPSVGSAATAPASKAGTLAATANEAAPDSSNYEVIVIDVTPTFAREREFEKILTQQNVAFRRGELRGLQKKQETPREKYDAISTKDTEELPYEVDATPEQVDQILHQMRQDRLGVGAIAKDQTANVNRAQQKLVVDEKAAAAGARQSQSRANKRETNQFLLRVVDPLPAVKSRN